MDCSMSGINIATFCTYSMRRAFSIIYTHFSCPLVRFQAQSERRNSFSNQISPQNNGGNGISYVRFCKAINMLRTPERGNTMKTNKSNLKIVCQYPPKYYNMKIFAVNRRAKQIGFFEALHMRRIGVRDGKIGLPREDDTRNWVSPQVRMELEAFNEFNEKAWLQCEEMTADLHIEVEKLHQELERFKSQFQDFTADRKYHGEEGISTSIIRARRMKELSPFEKVSDRLTLIKALIAETENITRLKCERVQCHVAGRLAEYWRGCLQSNINSESIPPVPPALHACGEDTYMSQHNWSSRPKTAVGRQAGEEDYYA